MEQKIFLTNNPLELDVNTVEPQNSSSAVYEIMHLEKVVAQVSTLGEATVFNEQFMPFDLYLENVIGADIEVMINNVNNFYHWCASRVLSLDRKFAKEILNSIGVAQAITDKDRAMISLSYHCVSLTDVYWVRKSNEDISFAKINLYDNPLNEAVVNLSLKGRQMTVTNQELAPDLSTKGCFPKAWVRSEHGFRLLKGGSEDSVKRELLASEICQCFDIPQVKYYKDSYDGQIVSKSDIISSKEKSMVSKMAYDIFAENNDLDTIQVCTELDPVTYYGMNILDYLTGNTDRHPENWGFLVDNSTNQPVSLYPIMDFNQCFYSYDNIDGANCQTTHTKISQREAAVQAVKHIGLRQIKEMDMIKFKDMTEFAEMFIKRLDELKKF